MKILVSIVVLNVLIGALVLGTVSAEHEPIPPEHPHMLVLGLEFEGEQVVGFRKCVDLAANQALPLKSHHQHVHFGTAGEYLSQKAGHAVVPAAPAFHLPWSNCAELIAFFFPS